MAITEQKNNNGETTTTRKSVSFSSKKEKEIPSKKVASAAGDADFLWISSADDHDSLQHNSSFHQQKMQRKNSAARVDSVLLHYAWLLGGTVEKTHYFELRILVLGLIVWGFAGLSFTATPKLKTGGGVNEEEENMSAREAFLFALASWYVGCTSHLCGAMYLRAGCLYLSTRSNTAATVAVAPTPSSVVPLAVDPPVTTTTVATATTADSAGGVAEAVGTSITTIGDDTRPAGALLLDVESMWLGVHFAIITLIGVGGVAMVFRKPKGGPLGGVGVIITYIIIWWWARRTALTRWDNGCNKREHVDRQIKFFFRGYIFPGLLVVIGPMFIVPVVLRFVSVGALMAAYPLVVSAAEWLLITLLYKDHMVEHLSQQQLAFLARSWGSILETSKIGVLVVVSNHSNDLSALVLGTVMGILSDTSQRTNMIPITGSWCFHKLKNKLSILSDTLQRTNMAPITACWCFDKLKKNKLASIMPHQQGGLVDHQPPQQAGPVWTQPKLTRFELVYNSCSHTAAVWPVYQLILIKVMKFVLSTTATDPETGEVFTELVCSWPVIAVVGIGDILASHLLTEFVLWALGKWAPRFRVQTLEKMVLVSESPVVIMAVFLLLGYHSFITLSGMATLASSLDELDE